MRTLTTLITLAAISLAYNATLDRWPAFPGRTAAQTAVGVAYTILAAAWLLDRRRPWRPLAVLLAVFAAALDEITEPACSTTTGIPYHRTIWWGDTTHCVNIPYDCAIQPTAPSPKPDWSEFVAARRPDLLDLITIQS